MQELKSIREARQKPFLKKASRFNQEAVAAELGVTVQTYRSYEKDPSLMKLPTATKLASILGCKVSDSYLPMKGN